MPGGKFVKSPGFEALDGVRGPGFLAAELGLHIAMVRRVPQLFTEVSMVVHMVGAHGEERLAFGIHQPPAPVHFGGAEKTLALHQRAARSAGPGRDFGGGLGFRRRLGDGRRGIAIARPDSVHPEERPARADGFDLLGQFVADLRHFLIPIEDTSGDRGGSELDFHPVSPVGAPVEILALA